MNAKAAARPPKNAVIVGSTGAAKAKAKPKSPPAKTTRTAKQNQAEEKHMADYSYNGFGGKNDVVGTPPDLYAAMDAVYHFDHDPCPFHPKKDGLTSRWGKRNYVNPPYSECDKWLAKAVHEMQQHGALSVFLIPMRVNTRYWHEWVYPHAAEIWFLDGRVSFTGFDKPSPCPIGMVVFDPSHKRRGTLKKDGSHGYTWQRCRL